MMKLFPVVAFILTGSLCCQAQQIRETRINEKKVIELNISNDNPCTVVWPFPLQSYSVSGGSVTSKPKEAPAAFFISYAENSPVMDLRALSEEEDKTTYMNVVTADNRVFVVRLKRDNLNFDSSVKLTDVSAASREVKTFTPQIGSALLERTNIYPLLQKADSPLIEGSEQHVMGKSHVFDNGVKLNIETAVKWGKPNMIVFNGTMESSKKVFYDRSSFIVQVGDKKMHASIIHASGVVEPGKVHPVQIGLSDYDYPEVRDLDMDENEFSFTVTFEDRPTELRPSLLPLPEWDEQPTVTPSK